MINKAGRLMINCTSISGADAKCCLMMPMAGAMAAAAITVRSDMERIVAVTVFVILLIFSVVFLLIKKVSSHLNQLDLRD